MNKWEFEQQWYPGSSQEKRRWADFQKLDQSVEPENKTLELKFSTANFEIE